MDRKLSYIYCIWKISKLWIFLQEETIYRIKKSKKKKKKKNNFFQNIKSNEKYLGEKKYQNLSFKFFKRRNNIEFKN